MRHLLPNYQEGMSAMLSKTSSKSQLICLLAVTCVLMMGLYGCSSDPVQSDLTNYINKDYPALLDQETKISQEMLSVSEANYKDDATMRAMLVDHVIPDTQTLITKMEAVTPQTPEVKAVHQKWIDATKARLAAYQTLVKALDNQDKAGVEQYNQQLNDAGNQVKAYSDAVQKLAKDHNVTLTPK